MPISNLRKNKTESCELEVNPSSLIVVLNLANHAREACFRLYKARRKQHTLFHRWSRLEEGFI